MIDNHTRAIALAMAQHVGWKLTNRLLDHFGSLDAILAASSAKLQEVHGIGKKISANIRAIDLDKTAAELERYAEQGITVVTWQEPNYPAALNRLNDRPLALFWKGTITPADSQAIAIVGTRNATTESTIIAYEWGAAMAVRGWTVISGMARGIDTAAHSGALKAKGRTLAVLGSGVNTIYPPENEGLAKRIIENGAIISEVAPDTPISPAELAFRNRLISGLACATIVVEAGATSGAIYAAEDARAQGHPVYAVPNSAGTLAMLDQYARPLPADADVLIREITNS